MPIGRIVRYNAERGFGFVRADSENIPDVFIHVRELTRGGIKAPAVGTPLVYEIGERGGKDAVISCEPLKSWQVEVDDTAASDG